MSNNAIMTVGQMIDALREYDRDAVLRIAYPAEDDVNNYYVILKELSDTISIESASSTNNPIISVNNAHLLKSRY